MSEVQRHITSALQSLYDALADVDLQRRVLVTSIESVRDTFTGPPTEPVQEDSAPPRAGRKGSRRRMSDYPPRTDTHLDVDLSDLLVDLSGVSTRADRVERVAQAASLAGKTLLKVNEVAAVLLRGKDATPAEMKAERRVVGRGDD